MSVSVTQGRLWQLVAFLQPLPAREKLAKQALIEYVKKCVLPVRGGGGVVAATAAYVTGC